MPCLALRGGHVCPFYQCTWGNAFGTVSSIIVLPLGCACIHGLNAHAHNLTEAVALTRLGILKSCSPTAWLRLTAACILLDAGVAECRGPAAAA